MRDNDFHDNYRVRRPSPQPTQAAQSADNNGDLFNFYLALKAASDRLDARDEQLAAKAKAVSDRVKDVHDLILQCAVDGCLFPYKIEPTVALEEEQHPKGSAR